MHGAIKAVIVGSGMVITAAIGGVAATVIYIEERQSMKARDKEIEVERWEEAMRERHRKPKREIRHFTHEHPLTLVDSVPYGFCGACNQRVTRGWAYGCSHCNYYLHEVCAMDLVALSPCSYSRAREIQSPTNTAKISTFAHTCREKHVYEMYSNQEYKCNHCFTVGVGTRFRCDACHVNLHPVCAKSPTKIRSFMHPQHDLELKTKRHFGKCAICKHKTGSNIRVYRCKQCEFYVHPACSQLAQHLMHDLHSHPLQLRPAARSLRCDARCGSKCKRDKWCYRCQTCNVSIHIRCALQHAIRDMPFVGKLEIGEIIQLLKLSLKIVTEVIEITHMCA